MITFLSAIASKPGEFKDHAQDLNTAKKDLRRYKNRYRSNIKRLKKSWEGTDYDALERGSQVVNSNVTDTYGKVGAAAGSLKANGPIMKTQVDSMKRTKRQAEVMVFVVLPGPAVILEPRHSAEIAAAGPGAPAMIARLTVQAALYTTQLMTPYLTLMTQDITCAARLYTLGLMLTEIGDDTGNIDDVPGVFVCVR